ncbi:MAG: hypothetical protein MKZ68_02295 [Candidatus Thalassarchaeum sp.]|nr:hypothetical protein [Candidatus Thalassarchaeum sp.]|tara:strand:+ start:305 stop:2260 length:1956 start_codon:yes stop_codon:yes gene_type:complete
MAEGPASVLDLPPLRGNPFDLRPIEANRAEYLVGRDRLLAECREHLISQTPRMLLLVGDRGSGRTSFLNALASTTSRRPFIGQFWPEDDDPVQGIIHELSVYLGGFDIPPSIQQASDKMVEILDKETGTLPLVALDYPANVDLNHMLSRLAPLLQRLRALIVVAVTPSQLAGLDEGVLDIFDDPHHLRNLDEKQIQILSNRRISRAANQKWNIRASLLTAIHQHTDGNPRRIIRLLRDLIDERHNPVDGGVLDRLTTWRAPPVQSEPEIFEEEEIESEIQEPTEEFEEVEIESEDEISQIDDFELEEEEPDDLWDDDDDEEESWNDEFEAPDEIWTTPEEPESLEVEEERFHQAEQIPEPEPSEVYQRADDESGFYFVEEGTEPPELPESRKPKGNFGRLLGRTLQANDRMPTTGDDTPIQVAEPHKSLVPRTPVKEMPPESVEDEQSTARIDTSVESGIEESVFHDDQSVWMVDSDSKSTLPNNPRVFEPIAPEPEPVVEEIDTEWFVDDAPVEDEFEPIPEPVFEPEPPQVSIPSIPTTPPPTPVQVPVQVPVSLGPTWEPDLPFNPIVLQTLTEAERMIVEASSMREVSPSDNELQARLEVGRSRLSQIYNGMRRKGLLSVRKQGRTRYFKLSEAANQHLRGAPQEAA